MIAKIDLLPDKYRRRWLRNLLAVLTVFLVLSLMVLLTVIYRVQTERANIWRERTAEVDEEVRRYRAEIREMDELRDSADELEARLRELETLGPVLPFPKGTLTEIQRLVPADVSLSTMTLQHTTGGQMRGQSLSYQSITRLLARLEDSEYFAEPRLESLSLSKSGAPEEASLDFTITFKIVAASGERGERAQ